MIKRCAIYTRKSSEEGLEQDFNSLDAQHEACAAYIKSQASAGWKLVRDRYDDGGISGGTLERQGLQRLLADIAAGHIDIVVVYKVDRLTRSLLDFAKLVEAFDKAGTSFVSITQSFNTTTSMGRLTLNMLLSFAQFEREVTAERIRDKIAQSKARGMWMGGTPPIGYQPDGRSLAIVEEDAAIVRRIFSRYTQLGNVRLLAEELEQQGARSPARNASTGRAFGDRPFSRGQLYKILSNPTYIARIDHGGRSHKANFAAIIEQSRWDEVQATLAANINGTRGPAPAEASLLAGKLVDDRGVLDARKLASLLEIELPDEPLTLTVAARLKRNGCVMKLITPGGGAALPAVDHTLVRTIVRARTWWGQLCADPSLTVTGIAAREQVTKSYVTRIIRLAFLAPDILGAVLDGTAPAHLTTDRLTLGDVIPAGWNDQRRAFGIVARD